jgi:hypothetical protein
MLIIEESNDTALPSPRLANGVYFKSGQATVNANGDPDFTTGTITPFNVGDMREWNAVRAYIATGGFNKNYIVNIIGNVPVPGNQSYLSDGGMTGSPNTFNLNVSSYEGVPTPTTAGKISLRSNGTGTLALSGELNEDGNILNVPDYQTVILRELTLRGYGSNSDSLVYINGNGTFIMQNGKITGNSNTDSDSDYGRGGGVNNRGNFIMNGGEISGNYAANKGGGVFNYMSFTMNGGTISDNISTDGGGVYNDAFATFTMNGGEIGGNSATNGGGVNNAGTFKISNGVIYGKGSTDENTATVYNKSLFGSSAVLGTYADGTFTPNGKAISETNFTIRVVNGAVPGTDDNISGTWWEGANGTGAIKYDFTVTGGIIIDGEESYYYYSADGSTITFTNTAVGAISTSAFAFPNSHTLTFSDNTGGGAAFDDITVYRPDPSLALHYVWRNADGSIAFEFKNTGKVVIGGNEYDYSVSGNTITGGTGGQFTIRGTYLRLTGSWAGTYYRTATSSSSLTNTYGWYSSPAAAYDQGTAYLRFASGRLYVDGSSSFAYTTSGSTITFRYEDNSVYGTSTYSISGQVMTMTGSIGAGRWFAR